MSANGYGNRGNLMMAMQVEACNSERLRNASQRSMANQANNNGNCLDRVAARLSGWFARPRVMTQTSGSAS